MRGERAVPLWNNHNNSVSHQNKLRSLYWHILFLCLKHQQQSEVWWCEQKAHEENTNAFRLAKGGVADASRKSTSHSVNRKSSKGCSYEKENNHMEPVRKQTENPPSFIINKDRQTRLPGGESRHHAFRAEERTALPPKTQQLHTSRRCGVMVLLNTQFKCLSSAGYKIWWQLWPKQYKHF